MPDKLTDKQLEYFQGEMPEGVSIADFRDINNVKDFVLKYYPEVDLEIIPFCLSLEIALQNFINLVKEK